MFHAPPALHPRNRLINGTLAYLLLCGFLLIPCVATFYDFGHRHDTGHAEHHHELDATLPNAAPLEPTAVPDPFKLAVLAPALRSHPLNLTKGFVLTNLPRAPPQAG